MLGHVEIRPFAPEDAALLEGAYPLNAAVGNTLLMDGAPIAYAGIHRLIGKDFTFFHIVDDERGEALKREAPLFIHRVILDAIRQLKDGGIAEIYSIAEPKYPKAKTWLKALGFSPLQPAEKSVALAVIEHQLGGAQTWVRRL